MPEENGKLTPNEIEVLESWKTKHQCPVCDATDWVMGRQLVAIPPMTLAGQVAAGEKFRFYVEMVCGQCAILVPLHARTVGIL